jgi:hypothetical protein
VDRVHEAEAMTDPEIALRWDGLRRRDNVVEVVNTDHGGTWFVRTGMGRAPLFACPCCGAVFHSELQAKRAADGIYPMADPEADPGKASDV